MNRESLQFGQGSFVGNIMADQSFFEMPEHDQARILGWANSCPVVEELTDPNNTAQNRGPKAMAERYGQVNFWFGYIGREVGALNPELYDQLMTPVQRLSEEEVGKYEPESVPLNYRDEMAPLSTLAGYALPRLFIEQIGIGKGLDVTSVRERFIRGQEVLETAIPIARTPNELLALVAEGLSKTDDIAPPAVLKNILSKGWFDEHNAVTMLNDFKDSLQHLAPNIWNAYVSMLEADRAQLKLI